MSSRKRGGDAIREGSSKKAAPVESQPDPHDVVVIVDGHKFYCWKEELVADSKYFHRMFSADFAEKDQKEVTLVGVIDTEGFQFFLDSIDGVGIMTDELVEKALAIADYLESPVLEDLCIAFLTKESTFSKKEQFHLGDRHQSTKLVKEVCSTLKDKYELYEIVSANLDSLNSNTKTIVIEKTFDLLGLRYFSSPPLLEHSDQFIENKINQIKELIEVQNQHMVIIADQVRLLCEHVSLEGYINYKKEKIVQRDPRLQVLMNELQGVLDPIERNTIQAQINVIKYKHLYTSTENSIGEDENQRRVLLQTIPEILSIYPNIFNRDKRNRHREQEMRQGNRTIDIKYRQMAEEFDNRQVLPVIAPSQQTRWIDSIRQFQSITRTRYRQPNQLVSHDLKSNTLNFSNDAIFEIVLGHFPIIRGAYTRHQAEERNQLLTYIEDQTARAMIRQAVERLRQFIL